MLGPAGGRLDGTYVGAACAAASNPTSASGSIVGSGSAGVATSLINPLLAVLGVDWLRPLLGGDWPRGLPRESILISAAYSTPVTRRYTTSTRRLGPFLFLAGDSVRRMF